MSLDPILSAPLAIQIHATAATAALLLGAMVLFRRKGTPVHKLMGRVWVGLMLIVATSAIFISEIRLIGPFSPIHIFVLLTYWGVWEGIRQIRAGNVAAHQATMKSVYLGALLLTGAFTLLPGRRMHDVLFGADSGWMPSLIAIPLALALTATLWVRLMPKRRRTPAVS
jgi:uncharacterized membrane protein